MFVLNPYSGFFPLFIFFVVISFTYYLSNKFCNVLNVDQSNYTQTRVSPLDGLRGLLAISVFFCHSAVWYSYLHTGTWGYPLFSEDFGIYRRFGQSAVNLFFMITAFLFMSKLLKASKQASVDWVKLYVSRILRIFPLYLLSISALILIALIETNFILKDKLSDFLLSCFKWLTFTIYGWPPINQYPVIVINSGVQWSLEYEWYFYLFLPIISLFLKLDFSIKKSINMLSLFVFLNLLTICCVLGTIYFELKILDLSMLLESFFKVIINYLIDFKSSIYFSYLNVSKVFLVGILAAIIYRNNRIKLILTKPFFSFLVIALLCWQGWNYQLSAGALTLVLGFGFITVACGNDMFGLLNNKALKYLGEISYSIYLLHGIILFCVINYIFGVNTVKSYSMTSFWLVIAFSVFPMLIISTLTYTYIEMPAMKLVPKYSDYIKKLLIKKSIKPNSEVDGVLG